MDHLEYTANVNHANAEQAMAIAADERLRNAVQQAEATAEVTAAKAAPEDANATEASLTAATVTTSAAFSTC